MTMEVYALCDRPMISVGEWQTAIDELGFDLKLRSVRDLAQESGHLPALWRNREAGFECSTFPFRSLVETYDDIDFGGPWPCVYALYFGSFTGCVGAWIAAAASVRLTGGMVFDPQEGSLLTADEAARCAADTEAQVAAREPDMDGRP